MKERMRIPALLLTLLLALSLTACSAGSDAAMSAGNGMYGVTADAPAMEPMAPEDAVMEEADTNFSMSTTESLSQSDSIDPSGGAEVPAFAEKIIYSGHANIETTDFDNAIANLERTVKLYEGFIETSNTGGDTQRRNDGTTALVNRWADYTVRIPSARFDEFMAAAGEIVGNITSSGRSAQNVTTEYTDYEARLDSLTIQEERLLALLEESGDLESLITLEERLSEVRYEIESIERNLRNLDQRLAYSDVNLYIREVEVYTPTVPVTRSFGEKLSDAFADGWISFSRGLQNFTIGLVEVLPMLLLWLVILAAALLVIRKLVRRHRVKSAPQPAAKPEDTEDRKQQ